MNKIIKNIISFYIKIYINIYQKWADIIISQLNIINIYIDDPENQYISPLMKNIFETQFNQWLMRGVNLNIKMIYKNIYLK